jgi:hypothetical protein
MFCETAGFYYESWKILFVEVLLESKGIAAKALAKAISACRCRDRSWCC